MSKTELRSKSLEIFLRKKKNWISLRCFCFERWIVSETIVEWEATLLYLCSSIFGRTLTLSRCVRVRGGLERIDYAHWDWPAVLSFPHTHKQTHNPSSTLKRHIGHREFYSRVARQLQTHPSQSVSQAIHPGECFIHLFQNTFSNRHKFFSSPASFLLLIYFLKAFLKTCFLPPLNCLSSYSFFFFLDIFSYLLHFPF